MFRVVDTSVSKSPTQSCINVPPVETPKTVREATNCNHFALALQSEGVIHTDPGVPHGIQGKTVAYVLRQAQTNLAKDGLRFVDTEAKMRRAHSKMRTVTRAAQNAVLDNAQNIIPGLEKLKIQLLASGKRSEAACAAIQPLRSTSSRCMASGCLSLAGNHMFIFLQAGIVFLSFGSNSIAEWTTALFC